jgi:transposase
MILDQESWMNLRRFRALRQKGATYKEIAETTDLDWRTVKKYLQQDAPVTPPKASSRKGTQPQVIEPFREVIDAMLRAEPRITAFTIHERLVAEYGFTHSYQRVKLYVAQASRGSSPRTVMASGSGCAGAPPVRGHRGRAGAGGLGEEGDLLTGPQPAPAPALVAKARPVRRSTPST